MSDEGMSKSELVKAIQRKLKGVSPMLRSRVSTKALMRKDKRSLRRWLKKAHVIHSGEFKGDISFM